MQRTRAREPTFWRYIRRFYVNHPRGFYAVVTGNLCWFKDSGKTCPTATRRSCSFSEEVERMLLRARAKDGVTRLCCCGSKAWKIFCRTVAGSLRALHICVYVVGVGICDVGGERNYAFECVLTADSYIVYAFMQRYISLWRVRKRIFYYYAKVFRWNSGVIFNNLYSYLRRMYVGSCLMLN